MLGALLRTLRGERSAGEVAAALGVGRSAVYLWESTKEDPELRRVPRPRLLQALLDLYGASPEQRAQAWELSARAGVRNESEPSDAPSTLGDVQ